jgi:hypothetical protein
MWMKCESVKTVTSNLFVVSVVLRRKEKQWLWEFLEVALEMGFRISHVRNGCNDTP